MDDKKDKKKGFGSLFKKDRDKNSEQAESYAETREPDYSSLISAGNDTGGKTEPEPSGDHQNNNDLSMLLLKLRSEQTESEIQAKKPATSVPPIIDAEIQDERGGERPGVPDSGGDISELIRLKEQKEAEKQGIFGAGQDSGSLELKKIYEKMKISENKERSGEPEEYTEMESAHVEREPEVRHEMIVEEQAVSEKPEYVNQQKKEPEPTPAPAFTGQGSQRPKSFQEIINSVTKKPEDQKPEIKNEAYTENPENVERAQSVLGQLKKEEFKDYIVKGKPEAPVFTQSQQAEEEAEVVEIIAEPDEDYERYAAPEPVPSAPDNSPAHRAPLAKKTQWSDSGEEKDVGVVTVDQRSQDFSGLILPEGATFEIEEFKIKTQRKIIETEDKESVLSRIDQIFDQTLPSFDVDDITEKESKKAFKKAQKKEKGGVFGKFKADIIKVVEYDLTVHGPLVDLASKAEEGIDEVELYPVNEPYAYVRITYDKNSNEYLYNVLEPNLNKAEWELFAEIEQRLFETLDVNTKSITNDEAREILRTAVLEILRDYGIKLTPDKREKLIYNINKNFIGDGLIDPLMHDKYIEDISCDGLDTPIFVFHSNYESLQTNLIYNDSANLDSFVTKLAQRAGKYISIAEPMLDATMADGSRIQMTLGTEVTAHGSTFTIRKFKEEPITPTDLTEWGTFSPLSIAYIWMAVETGKSCIFAGGTASGKTTSLNAISLFIPPLAKIVTLEDTRELKLPHKNWIPSVTRESFDSDGKGSIDMYELLRAALRQRPEYILVGEVRGAEALTLFQAMSTGHVTYATMHADSVASAVHRLENPPLNVPRNMLNALDLVSVQVQARIGGKRIRRNKQLIEVLDIDPRTKELITNEVFKWYPSTDEIRYSGKSYILEEIMEERGWDDERMKEELKRRQEILEWMRIKNLRHYKDVGRVLMSYFRDPDAVIKVVRTDLYE